MSITREQYIRTTATRMAQGYLPAPEIGFDKDERGDTVHVGNVVVAAYDMAERMADEGEKRGYAPWPHSREAG